MFLRDASLNLTSSNEQIHRIKQVRVTCLFFQGHAEPIRGSEGWSSVGLVVSIVELVNFAFYTLPETMFSQTAGICLRFPVSNNAAE